MVHVGWLLDKRVVTNEASAAWPDSFFQSSAGCSSQVGLFMQVPVFAGSDTHLHVDFFSGKV